MLQVQIVEWWPENGARSPLWLAEGRNSVAVDTATLALEPEIAVRLAEWARAYAEDKLPIDGPGDQQWIEAGAALLREVRSALAGRYEVIVTEPWWGEAPTEV